MDVVVGKRGDRDVLSSPGRRIEEDTKLGVTEGGV